MVKIIKIVLLFSLSLFALKGNAATYCITGDNITDCSLETVYITDLTANIVNNGLILGDNWWSAIENDGGSYAHSITNNGTITALVDTIANYRTSNDSDGTMGSIAGGITNNLGATISGFHAIVNNSGDWSTQDSSYISFINNAGSIIGFNSNQGAPSTDVFVGILNTGLIDSITNTGSIYASRNTDISFGINNIGTITTLNNLQGMGNVNGALTLTGNLPTTYNIIITDSIHYGRLSATSSNGTMTFGVSSLSGGVNAIGNDYQDIIAGVAPGTITGTNGLTAGQYTTGTSNGYTYNLIFDGTYWDLNILSFALLGPSTEDTQYSLHTLASNLRTGFTQQIMATNFANMNTYDCDLFDAKGLCISAGGQQTYVDQPSSNFTSAVVTAGYRVSPTIRIGGFLNQNVNNSTGASVDISNGTPLMGLFAVWNQNEDHLGYQVKIANAYQDQDVRTIRDIVGTSEAGRGNTEINTQSYVGELSYAFRANEDKTLVRPYAAVRYTRVKQDGYTEQTTSTVTVPLTYSALSDRSTTALVGVKLDHKLAEKVHLTGSLGIEQDLYHHVDDLKATGVSGLTSENFNDNIKRTRPVASIGATYTPAKNQRIAGTVFYQQLPFQSTGATTAYVNYTIGF